ncbi:Myb-like_DNA-binding domain-containing protein [Hexamita inflata]|uniref:Myb-like DNA-binding domain-containing protein n=1 Tax=Hexamita inflata TaxID=28002 RepID=A0AA86QER7_9EUKA|nr:Myb-like DNA-binding domain-containing protein [Hexamita inflata]
MMQVANYQEAKLKISKSKKNGHSSTDHSSLASENSEMDSRSTRKGEWTNQEHVLFLNAILQEGLGKWKQIASFIGTRTPGQCQIHCYKLRQKLRLEDDRFVDWIRQQCMKSEPKPKNEPTYENSEFDPVHLFV